MKIARVVIIDNNLALNLYPLIYIGQTESSSYTPKAKLYDNSSIWLDQKGSIRWDQFAIN